MIRASVFVVLLLVGCSVAQSKPVAKPHAFKSDFLGETLSQWKKNHALDGIDYPACPPATTSAPIHECQGSEEETIANCRVKYVSYGFIRDRLYSIYITFPEDCYDDVANGLARKYGKPTSVERNVYQNGFGAKFNGSKAHWLNGVSWLVIEQFGSDRETSSAFWMHNALQQEADRILKAEKSKKASDL
jgi:hypothetical protein